MTLFYIIHPWKVFDIFHFRSPKTSQDRRMTIYAMDVAAQIIYKYICKTQYCKICIIGVLNRHVSAVSSAARKESRAEHILTSILYKG